MFRHEGAERSNWHNQLLAGYLALIAGFVNSAGFILIGSFTSHVTGNVGRFADDLALGRTAAAFAALMVVAYFLGAFFASMAIESNVVRRRSTVYGGLLFLEAGLLAMFALLSYLLDTANPRFRDIQALLLCLAMGLQNSLVTRLSGAVVRTTHLTGAVTDLGIEASRWFRLWRARLGERTHLRLVVGDGKAIEPRLPQTLLLLTLLLAFVTGSALGAILAAHSGQVALLIPTSFLVAGGLFAIYTGRELASLRR
ncbi:MAG: YoaK family protein [Proteobacteria bacterium]|nr:YoaK family protein [Pseudomonadota bacterium]